MPCLTLLSFLLQARKIELATFLQARVRAVLYRRRYLKMREAAIILTKHWRRVAARRLLHRRRWAASVIRL